MADTIIIDDVEDGEGSPQPAMCASTSSEHQDKKISPLKAKLPVATHITQSPFASAKKHTHVLQAENQKLFTEFVEHCSALTTDCPEVLTFLQSKHDKACEDYLSSVEFRNTLGRCLTRAQTNHSKTFVYINELCTVLRQHTTKKRQTLAKAEPGCSTSLLDTSQTTSVTVKSKDKTKGREDKEQDGTKSTAEEEQASTSGQQGDNTEADEEDEKKAKRASRKQIVYLENLLRVYNQEICRLQQAELSLDELGAEDSLYIQEHKLKRKMMKIYQKLCELKGCNSLTGRVIEQRIPYSGTRYPEINKKIERFINSPEARSNPPDYQDILQQVLRANERHKLCLNRKQLNQLAQEAFRETGSRMQERRHLDLVYNFGSTLTDKYKAATDPALCDPSLQRKLRSNREVALSHLEEVITKYAVKQDDTEEQERCRRQEKDSKDKEKSAKETENDEEEDDEEEEEDDEEDESSDPDIEEEIQASTQQNGADEENGDEEEDSNEVESARGGTDKDEQTDDQTGSISADEGESVKEEEEPAASDEAKSLISPLSDTLSPRESPSQSESLLADETQPMSNSHPAGPREPADSSNHVAVVHVSTSQLTKGPTDASPMAANEQPLPLSPTVVIEECDTQTTNGTSPPSSLRTTRSQRRKREENLSSNPQKTNNIILNDGDVEVLLDMGVYVCNSPHEVALTRADTPSQDLVSGSQRSPPAKKMKVSVATQCDPEEIIVLSDSDSDTSGSLV